MAVFGLRRDLSVSAAACRASGAIQTGLLSPRVRAMRSPSKPTELSGLGDKIHTASWEFLGLVSPPHPLKWEQTQTGLPFQPDSTTRSDSSPTVPSGPGETIISVSWGF